LSSLTGRLGIGAAAAQLTRPVPLVSQYGQSAGSALAAMTDA
jgi:hypothetical protein